MSWAPSAGVGSVAGERRQFPRGGVHQDVPGGGDALAVGRTVGDLCRAAVRVDAYRFVTGGDDGARGARGGCQRVGEGAHAADRYVPVAGAAADDVVEEAAVLLKRGVVGVGERADEGVGEDHAPDEVVGEVLLDRDTDRFLEQGPPGLLVVDGSAQFLAGGQRPGEGGEDALGDAAGHAVEALPGPVLALGAGEPGERLAGALLTTADEQPGGPSVTFGGGVRGDGAGADPEVEPQFPDDLLGQQADQVRVPGQPCVDAGERPGGHRCPAGVVQPFQHQYGASGPGQVGRGDETVVASADDDGVVRPGSLVCGHGSS